jgi:hypothetical protein
MRTTQKAAILLGGAILAAGCAAQKQSGFLNDYSILKPSKVISGALSYSKPDSDLAKYTQFIIDPVGVNFADAKKNGTYDPALLAQLTDYFRTQLINGLSKNYQVVDQPGPNVLRIQIAITGLKKAEPALNIHPATKLSGLGLGGASVEAQAVDSQSGEVQMAFMQTRDGDRLALLEGFQEWGHARQAMDFWASQLVKRLDTLHGTAK